MTGRTVSHYEILDRLGGGGMGEIFRARDSRLNRLVAIKVLPKNESGDTTPRMRFMQEARAASGLSHPNIITVHDILVDDGIDMLVMELVAGKTLSETVPGSGLPIPLALKYAVQIASALAAAHAAGIVHRDIKPSNIMITATGLVKVLDFGLAKPTFGAFTDDSTKTASISAPLTMQGTVVGTVNYMSPEQAEGKHIDARSDIFSFGIVLYEMVTGRSAFPGDSMIATMTAILRDDVRPVRELVPAVPVQLTEIIDKCLKKNRDERWQSMNEVLAALETLKLQYDTGAAPTAQVPVARKSGSKLLVPGLIAAAVAIAGGIWFAVGRRPAASQAPSTAAVTAKTGAATAPASATDGALTNDSIVQMLDAKVPASVIVDQIRSSKTQFDLSTAELIRLSKAGASESVIQAMRDPSKVPAVKSAASGSPAPANPGSAPPAASIPKASAETLISIADAVPFTISLAEDVPLDAPTGTPIQFTVSKDVVAGDNVVIAKGAAVTGQVADETRKKLVGGAKMTFQLNQADAVGGQKLKVRATPGGVPHRPMDSGRNGAKKKPKDVAATAGTEFVAYIDGNQSVTIRK